MEIEFPIAPPAIDKKISYSQYRRPVSEQRKKPGETAQPVQSMQFHELHGG